MFQCEGQKAGNAGLYQQEKSKTARGAHGPRVALQQVQTRAKTSNGDVTVIPRSLRGQTLKSRRNKKRILVASLPEWRS